MTNRHAKAFTGVGLVAAGAAALAGAYFLYGSKEGTIRRKKIKGWMLKMKGDVLERMESLKEVNEDLYNDVVDRVGAQYSKIKSASPEDIARMVVELKGYWKPLRRAVETQLGSKKPAPKAAKKKASPTKAAKARPATKKSKK